MLFWHTSSSQAHGIALLTEVPVCSAGVGNSSDRSLILSAGLKLSGSLKLLSSEAAQCSTAVFQARYMDLRWKEMGLSTI